MSERVKDGEKWTLEGEAQDKTMQTALTELTCSSAGSAPCASTRSLQSTQSPKREGVRERTEGV